jgi:hypothetical protein
MANPNIVNVTSILGENASVSLTSTSATSIVSNASASGKVLKINTLIVSNVDGTNACDITINKYSAAALGGSAFAIASTVSVPADASLIVIDKTTSIYLKENESIGATAGTANDLIVTCSWEDIS